MPELGPVLLLAAALFGGLWFLAWHSYARDEDDQEWLDPGQPPAQVAMMLVPGQHGSGRQVDCATGFRSRCYPDLLQTARAAIGLEED